MTNSITMEQLEILGKTATAAQEHFNEISMKDDFNLIEHEAAILEVRQRTQEWIDATLQFINKEKRK